MRLQKHRRLGPFSKTAPKSPIPSDVRGSSQTPASVRQLPMNHSSAVLRGSNGSNTRRSAASGALLSHLNVPVRVVFRPTVEHRPHVASLRLLHIYYSRTTTEGTPRPREP